LSAAHDVQLCGAKMSVRAARSRWGSLRLPTDKTAWNGARARGYERFRRMFEPVTSILNVLGMPIMRARSCPTSGPRQRARTFVLRGLKRKQGKLKSHDELKPTSFTELFSQCCCISAYAPRS